MKNTESTYTNARVGKQDRKKVEFLSRLHQLLPLELHVLAGFLLLLQPHHCLLGLMALIGLLLLPHLLLEQGQPAKFQFHLVQLQSGEGGGRRRI